MGVDYATDDQTTNDASRAHKYASNQKVRLTKKASVDPTPHHGMSATIHMNPGDSNGLPNVRGAQKSKRTVH